MLSFCVDVFQDKKKFRPINAQFQKFSLTWDHLSKTCFGAPLGRNMKMLLYKSYITFIQIYVLYAMHNLNFQFKFWRILRYMQYLSFSNLVMVTFHHKSMTLPRDGWNRQATIVKYTRGRPKWKWIVLYSDKLDNLPYVAS